MKLGVFAVLFQDLPVEEALDKIVSYGLSAVEVGCGGYPGNAHCKPSELLKDKTAIKNFKRLFEDRGLLISALSVHGNPLHPQEEMAKKFHQDWQDTVRLAGEMEVPVVITFSGCPGDSENSRYPNWVTCPWPPDYLSILKWQWEEKIIPYWKKEAEFANSYGIKKIAFEMHPGFAVYNVDTLLRLRKAVGPSIGANFDPSHLFWQGVDPVAAIRALGKENAIFHFHAKDTYIDPVNTAVNGVLDNKPYTQVLERSWIFRSVGYGHDYKVWKDIVSALRSVGYDYVMSIEHEDGLASIEEGLKKAITFLKEVILEEPPAVPWWT